MVIIGIDTGGTFTDFVFFEDGAIRTLKLPSTPKDPAQTIRKGLAPYLDRPFILLHGTTVATNAFLEQKMARTAFLSTRGFEHLLHIGRQNRIRVFDLEVQKPPSIVPLSLCRGVEERILGTGKVERNLSPGEFRAVADWLKATRIESVGILFLHSYRNPLHERQMAAYLREMGYRVSASHEILPEYREYERAVVTVLNAALLPVIRRYIHRLDRSLAGNRMYIIQSNGGLLSPEQIMKEPVRTLLSGPSGGVIAARRIARSKQVENLITLDMGGTSTDVSVIKEGRISLSQSASMAHLPIRLPMIDIETVGAGGGSIARVDSAGALRVGPQSAGADPGPACYGRSMLPTVTDAFVVTGAIRPEYFLGGNMKIYPRRSERAIGGLARAIGQDLSATAAGIIRISASNIERALRAITVEKGEDPRFFSLMPFGGAGGLVCCQLSRRLGIRQIIAPDYQGVFSALGMLFADFRKEFVRSLLLPYTRQNLPLIQQEFRQMEKEAREILKKEGFQKKTARLEKSVDIRYRGQSHELTVAFRSQFLRAFHRQHQRLYSYRLADEDCEVVNLRLAAVAPVIPSIVPRHRVPSRVSDRPVRHPVYHDGRRVPFTFYRQESLAAGQTLSTPAVITSPYSSLLVEDDHQARVDSRLNIVIWRQAHG